MNPRDRELLTGMGNCYEACGEDFEGTVRMVANSRHRETDEVKATLNRLRNMHHGDPEYQALRSRLPNSFPL
ncbi:MAG: tetratricopeptide repeat protein [Thermoplasmata archaeon]